MNQTYKTGQEEFWAGDFGDDYIGRNCEAALLPARVARFSRMFAGAAPISSAMELGANIGLNLHALKVLFPDLRAAAVEINGKAAEELARSDWVDVHQASILEFQSDETYDFTYTSTVMIHIEPKSLPLVYQSLYDQSSRYIGIMEYYSPTPVEIAYRGHDDRLFKRDFAGEMLDKFPDLKLVDYGFEYHRDPVFSLGDINWFLLEKQN